MKSGFFQKYNIFIIHYCNAFRSITADKKNRNPRKQNFVRPKKTQPQKKKNSGVGKKSGRDFGSFPSILLVSSSILLNRNSIR